MISSPNNLYQLFVKLPIRPTHLFSFQTILAITTLVIALSSLPHQANANENTSSLQGLSFSDHNYTKKKKQAWINKKVSYDKKIKNADLVMSFGQQTYPALHQLVDKLAKEHGINVVIQRGSCGKTAKKLKRKSIDVGAYCCPPMKGDRLPGLEFHTIGIAPIAFVTHPNNPLTNISSLDAQDIFRGEYIQWSKVPSVNNAQRLMFKNEKIQPVVRLHCKKRPGHWRHLLKNEDLMSSRLFEVGVIPDMVKQVANNEMAIGIETVYMLEKYKDKGVLKILRIDNHRPEQDKYVLNGEYPIYRTYNLTTWKGDGKNYKLAHTFVKALMAYIEKEGKQYGFISPSALRQAGWKFNGDELIAEPDNMPIIHEHM